MEYYASAKNHEGDLHGMKKASCQMIRMIKHDTMLYENLRKQWYVFQQAHNYS